MKKVILLIISSVLSLGLFIACSSPKEPNTITNNETINTNNKKTSNVTAKEQDVREIAFNQLTSNDKDRVSGTWKDSKLSNLTLKEGMGNISDKSYIGREVYLVDFATKGGGVQSNMIVYIGTDNNKLIGYGYVD